MSHFVHYREVFNVLLRGKMCVSPITFGTLKLVHYWYCVLCSECTYCLVTKRFC